jgi:hypothetical protein
MCKNGFWGVRDFRKCWRDKGFRMKLRFGDFSVLPREGTFKNDEGGMMSDE